MRVNNFMERQDLKELLVGLGLQAYTTAMEEEALDLEALSLAAAIDLRSVLKMPLGSALKLVNAARATEMVTATECSRPNSHQKRRSNLGATGPSIRVPHGDHDNNQCVKVTLPEFASTRSPSIGTQIDEFNNKDAADQTLPGQAMEDLEPPPRCKSVKKVVDNSIMRRDVLRFASADGGCPPPEADVDAQDSVHARMRPHRWPLLYSLRHIVHLWGWFDPVMPADHGATFKYNLYFSKEGEELKGHLLALSDMWVVGLSLMIGTMAELWGVFPEEGVPKQLTAFHTILVGSNLMAGTCALIVCGVTYINVSAVHTDNMHAYLVGAMGAFQASEVLLVATLWQTLAIIGLTAYTKLYTLEMDHWIWYVMLSVMYLIIVPSAVAAITIFNRLTLDSGYMRPVRIGPNRDQLTESFKSPEAVLDHEFKKAWGRTFQVQGRYKVLAKPWFLRSTTRLT